MYTLACVLGLAYFAFFHLFFFPAIFFSYLYILLNILLIIYSYFSTHKRFFLLYLQLLSMHDCCDHSIRLSQSFSCFLEAHVDLILFLTQYSSRVSTSFQCKIETNFSKFSPIFPEVCPLLLASYFSKKNLLAESVQPYLCLLD